MDKIQNNNPANDPKLKPVKSHSVFKPNYSLLTTQLFGLIQPHMAAEVVPDDSDVQFRTGTDIDTYTLKAPMMTPVQIHKDHFFVPLRAILPHGADLIVTNPRTGDDIVAENVNSIIGLSPTLEFLEFATGADQLAIVLANQQGTPATKQSHYIAQMLGYSLWYYSVTAQLFSVGSLARNLGYSFDVLNWASDQTDFHDLTFDEFFERIFAWIPSQIDTFEVKLARMVASSTSTSGTDADYDNKTLYVHMADIDNAHQYSNHVSFRRLLQILLQGHVFIEQVTVTSADLATGVSDNNVVPIPMDSTGMNCSNVSGVPSVGMNLALVDQKVNIDRILAYQLACAQFYTDDAVDYVYNNDIWQDNMKTLAMQTYRIQSMDYAEYLLNGISHQYDPCAGEILRFMISAASQYVNIANATLVDASYFTALAAPEKALPALGYLFNVFGYQRSLRYRDYLVGAKTYPLAVDSSNATVVQVSMSNTVDVVDVTKGIMAQKFLNQVNRIGRSIKNYTQGIFGTTPMEDPHEAKFLSAIQWVVGAEETTNTGDDQLTNPKSITSHLRNDSSRFVFSFGTGEYGILIGMTYFDMPRSYGFSFDRPVFHIDRFDMFNPYMQHIGDQEVFGLEVDSKQLNPFGYQGRYMEYKQRLDRAAGGFLSRELPGYALVANPTLMRQPWDTDCVISPDFIRSRPVEFDQFYLSLTGVTMANYFHFIIRHDNQITMKRPMEAAPSIL